MNNGNIDKSSSIAGSITSQPKNSSSSSQTSQETSEDTHDQHPSGLDWHSKLKQVYRDIQDCQHLFYRYAGTHDEPKLEALMDMLDTVINTLEGGGNVHTFIDRPSTQPDT